MVKMCYGKSKIKKCVVSVILSLSMAVSVLAGYHSVQKVDAAEPLTLHNPDVDMDAMCAGQKVTWDCLWFGSYPQTEVKNTDSEYEALQSAEGWDENGDAVVNGAKYRRMLEGDATYATSGYISYYDWEDDTTYHYFKYEPVKWRILKTDGSKVMLLSDIVLDDRKYNTEDENTTWETSTIRSWLNGYDADYNQESISYTGNNFIDSAFTAEEQSAIEDTDVVNDDNFTLGTEGGNNTVDKIFLLSALEVYKDAASAYGFTKSSSTDDEGRRCKGSDYAKAMVVDNSTSTDYRGNCDWWLRSPGNARDNAVCVSDDGNVNLHGGNVYQSFYGVRVALNLNLTSSNLCTYAGTVCSDGTVGTTWEPSTEEPTTEEISTEEPTMKESTTEEPTSEESTTEELTTEEPTTEEPTSEKPPVKKSQTLNVIKSYKRTYGDKSFKLNVKLTKGNGTLKYTTSDKSVAVADKNGKVTIKGTGICTITVTASATDTYKSASAKITIIIKPKKNSVAKVKASGSRILTVTWKKDTKCSGYELCYSTSKSYPKKTTKTVNISKNKTTSYKIKKLAKGKKYYIRIRSYKNIKQGEKTKKLYGDWSAGKQSGKVR